MTEHQPLAMLRKHVELLAKARASLAEAKLDHAAKLDEFKTANAPLLARLHARAESVKELEGTIREEALREYKLRKNVAPAPGVKVKIFHPVEIIDPEKGLAWAKLTGLALIPEALDVAALAKIASVTALPEGIAKVNDEPRVEIATKLEEALAKAPPAAPASGPDVVTDAIAKHRAAAEREAYREGIPEREPWDVS